MNNRLVYKEMIIHECVGIQKKIIVYSRTYLNRDNWDRRGLDYQTVWI